jgi:hypothetical protein
LIETLANNMLGLADILLALGYLMDNAKEVAVDTHSLLRSPLFGDAYEAALLRILQWTSL